MKNPNSLTIQSNGVTLAAYDGSAAKTANIPLMKAATASAAGSPGLVPAPAAGSQAAKYLRADGTWQTPTNTTYAVATETNDGLMSSKDKKLLGSTDISNIGNGTVTGAVAQLNSNLFESESIIVVDKGHTIAAIISGVPAGKIRTYRLQDIPVDYPSNMLSSGNTSNPVLTILKSSDVLSYMSIIAPNISSGIPHIMYGYFNTGKVYWGEIQ